MNRELIYMHGPESPYTDTSSLPAQIAPKRFFNYHSLSQAQMQLQLLDERLEILQSYYGDPFGEIQLGRNLVYQALSQGLNNFTETTYRLPRSMYSVANQIRLAKRFAATPAGDLYYQSRISGPNDIIPIQECESILDNLQDLFFEDNYGNFISTPQSDERIRQYEDCKDKASWSRILNEKWAESAPHLVYEYVSNTNAVPGTVTTKAILQKQALGIISSITGLKRDNLRQWLDNGIMRANVIEGNSPYNALESIDLLKIGGQNPAQISSAPRIGVIETATVLAIIKIVSALVAAIGATVALVNQIKAQNAARAAALNNTPGYGTGDFSGTYQDWIGYGGQTTIPNPGNAGSTQEQQLASLGPIALIIGGALLMNQKKKK